MDTLVKMMTWEKIIGWSSVGVAVVILTLGCLWYMTYALFKYHKRNQSNKKKRTK